MQLDETDCNKDNQNCVKDCNAFAEGHNNLCALVLV